MYTAVQDTVDATMSWIPAQRRQIAPASGQPSNHHRATPTGQEKAGARAGPAVSTRWIPHWFEHVPAFRGKLYDDLLLRVMLYKAQQMPFSAIEASVGEAERELLTGFGFRPAGLPQTGQDIVLFVPCSGVIWNSACKHVVHSGEKPE